MKNFLLIILFFLIGVSVSEGARIHKEIYYQKGWCEAHEGIMEYVLKDLSRVDCLTKTHAIEFDFASKWAESIGQALLYGVMTGRQAGIVIIVENIKDERYLKRLRITLSQTRKPVKVWIVYRDFCLNCL